jgi:ATP-dependent Clp protease ATP-binding subunit ClpB
MGADLIQKNFKDYDEISGFATIETTKLEIMELLKKLLRPEFLNRLDEIIMFKPLNKSEIKEIVTLQLEELKLQIKEKGFIIHFDEKVVDILSDHGYEPEYGARPLKRLIQKNIVNELSRQLLSHGLEKDKQYDLSLNSNGQLNLTKSKPVVKEH